MAALSITYLLLLAGIIVIIMIRDAFRGYDELLSLRNFFLFGFLIFQVTGAAYMVAKGGAGEFIPNDIPSAAIAYCAKLTIFTVLFFLAEKMITAPCDRVYSRLHKGTFRMPPASLMTIAVVAIPCGMLCQIVLVRLPVIGPGMNHLGAGLFAVGAGLAAWVAAPRLKNPIYVGIALAIILACMSMTFYKNFGRRDLLGVIVAVMWAAYYSRWRSLETGKLIIRLGFVGVAGTILLFAVTSVRSGEFNKRGIVENISSLRDARITDGFDDVLSGQAASMASMWLIESRPQDKAYDTLHSARVLITMPIPRRVWPDKPMALALSMPQVERHIPGKPDFFNIGPGLIGHIENDNPWLAMWLYAFFLAGIIRIFDRATAWFADNPFVVLPMGAAIGQFIAMARGELGTFVFIAIINIVGAFCIMRAIFVTLKFLGLIKIQSDEYEEWEYDYGTDYDEAYEH